MNPITWIKNKRDVQLNKMKMANANKKEDVKFFLHVLEHEHRVYSNFIFMPDHSAYLTKLKSIGFKQLSEDDGTYLKTGSQFVHYYNNALNISIFVVDREFWKALTTTIDVVTQIYAPIESEFKAICTIFKAIQTYEPEKG